MTNPKDKSKQQQDEEIAKLAAASAEAAKKLQEKMVLQQQRSASSVDVDSQGEDLSDSDAAISMQSLVPKDKKKLNDSFIEAYKNYIRDRNPKLDNQTQKDCIDNATNENDPTFKFFSKDEAFSFLKERAAAGNEFLLGNVNRVRTKDAVFKSFTGEYAFSDGKDGKLYTGKFEPNTIARVTKHGEFIVSNPDFKERVYKTFKDGDEAGLKALLDSLEPVSTKDKLAALKSDETLALPESNSMKSRNF